MNLAITYIPMVRILILSIMILFTLRGNEVRADEKTDSIAENLLKQVVLNDDDALFYREVIQCGELTKDQLYVNVNYWFTKYFEDANAVIKLNDREAGCIIGEGLVKNIAGRTKGFNAYYVSIRPVIRVDFKDYRIRVTVTIPNYEVVRSIGGGTVAFFMGGGRASNFNEVWSFSTCYPFDIDDKRKGRDFLGPALIMADASVKDIIRGIEDAAKDVADTICSDDDW